MKISAKKGVFLLAIFLAGGLYLVGMFYFAPDESGRFAQSGRVLPSVLGTSVKRWRLDQNEILLGFSAGQGEYKQDKLFLTYSPQNKKRWSRITRGADGLLVYEQEIGQEYDSPSWRPDSNLFLISSSRSQAKIELLPAGRTYRAATP